MLFKNRTLKHTCISKRIRISRTQSSQNGATLSSLSSPPRRDSAQNSSSGLSMQSSRANDARDMCSRSPQCGSVFAIEPMTSTFIDLRLDRTSGTSYHSPSTQCERSEWSECVYICVCVCSVWCSRRVQSCAPVRAIRTRVRCVLTHELCSLFTLRRLNRALHTSSYSNLRE